MGATSNGAPLAIDYKSIELNDHPYYSWYLNAIMGSCQLKCMFFKYSFLFVYQVFVCLFKKNYEKSSRKVWLVLFECCNFAPAITKQRKRCRRLRIVL